MISGHTTMVLATREAMLIAAPTTHQWNVVSPVLCHGWRKLMYFRQNIEEKIRPNFPPHQVLPPLRSLNEPLFWRKASGYQKTSWGPGTLGWLLPLRLRQIAESSNHAWFGVQNNHTILCIIPSYVTQWSTGSSWIDIPLTVRDCSSSTNFPERSII